MRRIQHASWALLVFAGISGFFLWNMGYIRIGAAAMESEEHAGHGPEEDACALETDSCALEADTCEAGYAEEAAHVGEEDDCCPAEEAMAEGVWAVQCEHEVAIVDCDECRYEVGMVKVAGPSAELIEGVAAEQGRRVRRLELTGTIELDATRRVDVFPVAGGQVARVGKYLGERVEKGEVLAVIRSFELGQAQGRYLESEAALELAREVHEREKRLFEREISSRGEFEQAAGELEAARARRASAVTELRLLGLDDEAIAGLSSEGEGAELVVRAPQSGVVIEHGVAAGRLVGREEKLMTIADMSSLWVWGDVYERDLAELAERFEAGQVAASVEVAAYPGRRFEGVVDLIGNTLDPGTRTVKVRVRVANPGGLLKAGMFARIAVELGEAREVVTVPQEAVVRDEGEAFVFRRVGEELWQRCDVRVGATREGRTEVLEGLGAGEVVVGKGAFMLKSDILREKMGAGCAH